MFDIFLVILGAVLGFGLSFLTTIINHQLDRHGKLLLYYKHITMELVPPNITFIPENSNYNLIIPLYFEFQNTSNTPRVIRNINLYLYNKGELVDKFQQEPCVEIGNEKSKEYYNYGNEKSSYSFTLPSTSIQAQECFFLYTIHNSKVSEKSFDEIRFAYYDEKDRKNESLFLKVPDGWNTKQLYEEKDKDEFVKLKCHKVKNKENKKWTTY